jgi:DnaJ-domain-containing protein 1
LFWLLGFIVVAHLLARSGMIKQKVAQASSRMRSSASSPKMSREKALSVLGVHEGATEREINDRYKELMRRVHPDQGGSSYLATELNEAKRVLSGR